MMGYTDGRVAPSAERYLQLTASAEAGPLDIGQPYPFFLAHQLDAPVDEFATRLGVAGRLDRRVEVRRHPRAGGASAAAQVWIWSRGEELVTERFPEIVAAARALPDGTVLDGEIVVWKDGRVAPFDLLQQRIGRKTLTKKVLADAPVGFIAYDLLECRRRRPARAAAARAARAARGAASPRSPSIQPRRRSRRPTSWEALAELRRESRARGVEGFMLKHRAGPLRHRPAQAGRPRRRHLVEVEDRSAQRRLRPRLRAGRPRPARERLHRLHLRGLEPARRRCRRGGGGRSRRSRAREPPRPRRCSWSPFAKAYSGLTDEEFRDVDRVIRRTTLEKFGPVRSVRPTLVFELGFEGINRSTRHKSGIAVRFPRMLRIRDDKPLHEADTLPTLEALLRLAV